MRAESQAEVLRPHRNLPGHETAAWHLEMVVDEWSFRDRGSSEGRRLLVARLVEAGGAGAGRRHPA
jgi:hypothetical protein